MEFDNLSLKTNQVTLRFWWKFQVGAQGKETLLILNFA